MAQLHFAATARRASGAPAHALAVALASHPFGTVRGAATSAWAPRRSPRGGRDGGRDALVEAPPPSRMISVHKGLRIQAALCVERPPLRLVEPDYVKQWRAFREAWELRTSNDLTLDDEIVKMRFHFYFLDDPAVARRIMGSRAGPKRLGAGAGRGKMEVGDVGGHHYLAQGGLMRPGRSSMLGTGPGEGDLGALLADEGVDLRLRRRSGKTDDEGGSTARRGREVVERDRDVRSIERLKNRSLFLLVKYIHARHWTFPKADRMHGMSMERTLMRLCDQQLGSDFEPYIVGAAPFSHRRRVSDRLPGIKGRKIFYYRARFVPGQQLDPPSPGRVKDCAWCSHEELPKYLSEGEWRAVRDGLPLDCLG
eukprot:NODE_7318_length_1590_cov_15.033493.p1 GENE.NODE_7318_length_1590_cov_15.033493~~NODE_7318_length_1590_cov_15.033493.p1  ORF type:complete len:396 (+),score=84.94 NODE_7318_length_1590_cov_15.033493:88-1188(+)